MTYDQHRRLINALRRIERAQKSMWKNRAKYSEARLARVVAYLDIQDIVRAT